MDLTNFCIYNKMSSNVILHPRASCYFLHTNILFCIHKFIRYCNIFKEAKITFSYYNYL